MQKAKKLIRFFLGVPVTVVAFLFILKVFLDNQTLILKSFASLNPILFLVGIFFFSLFFAIKSFVWIEILKKRGYTPPIRASIWNYSLAEIKRYIPGSIFAFMGRMQSMAEVVPQKETLKGIGIEAVLLVTSAAVLSIPGLFYSVIKAEQNFPLLKAVGPIAMVVVVIVAGTFAYSRVRKTILSYFDCFLLFLLAWLTYALGCVFVAISFSYFYPTNFIFILSFFVLSWLAGYLLFITPMGLGLRELVTIGSLSFFVPTSIASAIAVLTRIGMIVGELFYLGIVFCIKRLKNNSQFFKLNPYLTIVVFLALIYFTYYTTYTFMRHDAYLSGRFDLGNMSQTVWDTTHGHFFRLTNPDGVENISRLADHSDIILVLFAPLYLVFPTPKLLLLVQSFTIAVGGILIYLLSKRIIKSEKLSLVLAVSFFFNFWISEQNIFDFHAVSVGTTLLLATYYFLVKKRYIWFFIFLILSVMTKENVFLVASFFGIYIFFVHKKRVIGTLLTLIPAILFFYLTAKAIPAARGSAHFALQYYSYIGNSTLGIVKNAIFYPQVIFSHLFRFSTLFYIHKLLVPTGYLALLSPLYLAFALPEIAIYTLSSNPGLRSDQYHYGAIIMPFVYISTIYGIAFILKKIKQPLAEKGLMYYLLGVTILTTYAYSPLPGMLGADYGPFLKNDAVSLNSYLSLIPKNASVSASNNLGAHLSNRDNIFVVPFGIYSADYVALYGEKKNMVSMVDTQKYNALVQNEKINFYLYKKNEMKNCIGNCTP